MWALPTSPGDTPGQPRLGPSASLFQPGPSEPTKQERRQTGRERDASSKWPGTPSMRTAGGVSSALPLPALGMKWQQNRCTTARLVQRQIVSANVTTTFNSNSTKSRNHHKSAENKMSRSSQETCFLGTTSANYCREQFLPHRIVETITRDEPTTNARTVVEEENPRNSTATPRRGRGLEVWPQWVGRPTRHPCPRRLSWSGDSEVGSL